MISVDKLNEYLHELALLKAGRKMDERDHALYARELSPLTSDQAVDGVINEIRRQCEFRPTAAQVGKMVEDVAEILTGGMAQARRLMLPPPPAKPVQEETKARARERIAALRREKPAGVLPAYQGRQGDDIPPVVLEDLAEVRRKMAERLPKPEEEKPAVNIMTEEEVILAGVFAE